MQSTYYEDFIMRQIRLMVAAIVRTIFGKDSIAYTVTDPANKTETDELYLHLGSLLDAGEINEAEDLLFKFLNPDDQDVLLLAVDFYQRLNMLSDEDLLRCHFSRQEIYDGLLEVQRFYGLNL
jgi:hypothetical protein